jgi:hypothetical protein
MWRLALKLTQQARMQQLVFGEGHVAEHKRACQYLCGVNLP